MPDRILIIDDEPNITRSFSSLLKDEGYLTSTSASAEEASAACAEDDFDLILLDLNLPGKSGVDFLKNMKKELSPPLVLIISGQGDIPTALEAVRLGAIDYLEKPVKPEKLISSVKSALMLATANRQRALIVENIDENSRITGNSKAVKKLYDIISQVAPTDTTVLINGENGTGKELAATRIFLESNRRNKPFIKVNCPGIPETLFESELFGHKKGAFTGAIKDYPGKFNLADGGTIFLDEIGDLPLSCQAKLLRVLESGEVETIGTTEKQLVNVRVICATNRNLKMLIDNGKFREDLYYRISVFTVEVPPLQQRREDIPALIGEFLSRYDPSGKTRLSPDAIAYLATLDYPGNVRQLKNIIERITIIYRDQMVIPEHLISQLGETTQYQYPDDRNLSLSEKLIQLEKIIIKKSLEQCDGNISETARLLKIDRANLSRKIKEYKFK